VKEAIIAIIISVALLFVGALIEHRLPEVIEPIWKTLGL
jgi:hypothetical protein